MCCTNTVALSCCRNEHWDFLIASLVSVYILCVLCPFYYSLLPLLSWTQWSFGLHCLAVYCPSFTTFLIIFNFSLLLFSCCSDTISLRGSIKFHLIWTWWNCVRLSKELLLLYLVQILNWVWCWDPAALILRLMDFYFPLFQMWRFCFTFIQVIFTELSLFMLHAASCVVHRLPWSFFLHISSTVQVKQWTRWLNWNIHAPVHLAQCILHYWTVFSPCTAHLCRKQTGFTQNKNSTDICIIYSVDIHIHTGGSGWTLLSEHWSFLPLTSNWYFYDCNYLITLTTSLTKYPWQQLSSNLK